ncbi:unnamed protein product [Psylliodes chrysocephalus]|uniref:histone acetyltransferase n=1 Tax=Psylliodes chrysocephalus TaxID=3402493 RepID=A0A9P0DFV9_9CUCU|nr:unnamed protein product [Psylliodes chrysocephala]
MANENNCNGHFTEDDEMSSYKKDSNLAVTFRILYDTEITGKDFYLSFNPVMSHQIFGENESIFGYRSLTITLNYLHNSAKCYVNIKNSGQIKSDVHKPDDIMESLNPWLPENYVTKEEDFLMLHKTEKHDLIHGKILHEFKDKQKCQLFPDDEIFSTYKVTHCDLTDDNFKSFHSRFETFVIWFIDGANFIDLDDEKWEIFYVYEEITHPKTQKIYVTPVGYCTVYKFFAYPESIRPRISQFFILPSHQRLGLGTALYETVFKVFQSKSEVVDITVEEPTSNFQIIRDIHDCLMVKKSFSENLMKVFKSPPKKIFNKMKDMKLGKKQSQRVYNILCCLEAESSKTTYDQHLNNIKNKIEKDVKEKMNGIKKARDEAGFEVNMDVISDMKTMIESEFKRYMEDLEISIKCIKKTLEV